MAYHFFKLFCVVGNHGAKVKGLREDWKQKKCLGLAAQKLFSKRILMHLGLMPLSSAK